MSDQNHLDERLAGHFGQEHSPLPADSFVAATMHKVRAGRRRAQALRLGVRIAALGAIVAASPWLITGAARLNAVLDASLSQVTGLPVALGLGLLVVVVLVATRLRSR
jgi:hypothetical protein